MSRLRRLSEWMLRRRHPAALIVVGLVLCAPSLWVGLQGDDGHVRPGLTDDVRRQVQAGTFCLQPDRVQAEEDLLEVFAGAILRVHNGQGSNPLHHRAPFRNVHAAAGRARRPRETVHRYGCGTGVSDAGRPRGSPGSHPVNGGAGGGGLQRVSGPVGPMNRGRSLGDTGSGRRWGPRVRVSRGAASRPNRYNSRSLGGRNSSPGGAGTW